MKNCWPRLVFAVLLQSVLPHPADSTAPPPPINVHIISTNFKHVLCWDPAPAAAPPAAAPPARYLVLKRARGRRWKELSSSETCLQMKLKNEVQYELAVKTLFNTTMSPLSNIVTFYPAMQSQIGPPHLSLSSCGDCIQINISLPQADKDANIPDIQKYYGVPFTVLYRKKNDWRLMNLTTTSRSFTLSNLEKGAEYCVQVTLTTHLNKHTVPSAWTCIPSSAVPETELSGVVAPLLSVGILLLIFITVFLGYTGYLWKLAVPLPEALMVALASELTFTPERTVLDPLDLQSRWRPDRPVAPPVAATPTYYSELEVDEEEEEDGCNSNYMNPGLSSGRQLFPDGPSPSEDSENFAVKQPLDPDEPRPAPSGDPAPPREDFAPPEEPLAPPREPPALPGVQDLAKEESEELQSCSSHVDLFSVILASLAVKEESLQEEQEEQEEQEHCDFFIESSIKSQFSDDVKPSLMDSQSKAGFESLEKMRCHGDLDVSECEGDEVNPLLQVEEEERREQGLSEYLVHQ